MRYCSSYLIVSFQSFKNILLQNLSLRNVFNETSSSNERLDHLNEVQRRETYLRCFQSISSYLSSALNRLEYQIICIFYSFIQRDSLEDLQLFQLIVHHYNPSYSLFIPDYLDDPRRPSFVSKSSWSLLLIKEIEERFVHLNDHLIDYEIEWKEYLFSSNEIDLLNECPYERTNQLKWNLIQRFLLWFILQPNQVNSLSRLFFFRFHCRFV